MTHPMIVLAHGFGGSGLLHPLTGWDHMIAMLAVGAWSAQLGGRALYLIPGVFVLAMAIGSVLGIAGFAVPGTEPVILASAAILAAVVLLRIRVALLVAALAMVAFGAAHGYAHGTALPARATHVQYVTGVLVTTAALHVAGVVLALLAQERSAPPE